jgi:PPK2 family polyphosphate:nucleotide phosphotransferase
VTFMDSDRWRVAPRTDLDLGTIDTASTEGAPGRKRETRATFGEMLETLREAQERLWAERKQSLLIVLQAIDAGGKDGTIEHLFRGMNPVGARVASFRVPTEHELAHDFLWRVHKQTPGKGEIVVFNRSHYEDVLVVRVHDIVPEAVWRPRFAHINAFEDNLRAARTRIIKLFLHISKDEQARRFQARIDEPDKRWKFRLDDLKERDRWDDYQHAFAEAISRTSTEGAPWYVIPADNKWYRNWAVTRIVLEALDDMAPQYPPVDDLDGVVVR